MAAGEFDLQFDERARGAASALIALALVEDLGGVGDLTTRALIESDRGGCVSLVSREAGVLAGLPAAQMVFERLDPHVAWDVKLPDGSPLEPGGVIAGVSGPLRALLAGERTALNFLGHLSGIATLTRRFVEAVRGTGAVILDTRKTLPGWRPLAKYAVRCGGGTNHRMGLYDGVLIKDNHLAAWSSRPAASSPAASPPAASGGPAAHSLREAVERARDRSPDGTSIEIEVDTLDQLAEALPARPDVVLLDNMPPEIIREAVRLRDTAAPSVLLEASGGITLENVAAVAAAGIDRISVGALTHSAPALDVAFDFQTAAE